MPQITGLANNIVLTWCFLGLGLAFAFSLVRIHGPKDADDIPVDETLDLPEWKPDFGDEVAIA